MGDPLTLHERARALLGEGKGAEAAALLEEIVAVDDRDATCWRDLGEARLLAGRREAAIEAFDRAVSMAPDDAATRLRYGLALEALGAFDDAAYQLLQADKRAPDDASILRALGRVFHEKGLHDKAVRFLGRATKIAPHDARAFYSLGVVHDARNDPGAAIAALRESVRLDPTFVDARRTLVDALASIGEHAQAIAALDELLAVAPRDEQAAKNREVLSHALAEMQHHRLLGRRAQDLERSALVQEGEMKRKGRMTDGATRYAAKLAEMYVQTRDVAPGQSVVAGSFESAGTISSMMLVVTDPKRATQRRDDVFGVTVVGKDGRRGPADFATAVSLTFLREAIGVPLTQAAVFYGRLVAGEPRIDFAGASMRFASRAHATKEGEELHGLLCEEIGETT